MQWQYRRSKNIGPALMRCGVFDISHMGGSPSKGDGVKSSPCNGSVPTDLDRNRPRRSALHRLLTRRAHRDDLNHPTTLGPA